MSDEIAGASAQVETPVADSSTPDAVLDTAFSEPSEPAASSDTPAPVDSVQEPVAATQQPQDPAAPESGVKGEPPREKWDKILANARAKAREEALAEHRDQLEVVANLKRDYAGTLAQLLEEGAADPRFSDALTKKAASLLAARRKAAADDLRPEPDQGDDKFVWYSPEQQAKLDAWKTRQIKGELLNEFKPLIEMRKELEDHKQTEKLKREAFSMAEERGAQWKAMPFFEDNKEAILTRQQEIYTEAEAAGQRGEGRFDPVNTPWVALQQAYAEVIRTQHLPKLQSQQTDSLVAQAARKRAGSSSDPAASAPAQPRKPRTVDEALDQAFDAVIT